ncbi:MAG: hypothetical protein K1X74_15135 [Pirellulales bacterium]|nr:hypothetical protein [Pirellulales bacterium]
MKYSLRTLVLVVTVVAVLLAVVGLRINQEMRRARHEAAVADALTTAGAIVLTQRAGWSLLRYDQIVMVDVGDLNSEPSLGSSVWMRNAIAFGDDDVRLLADCRGTEIVRLRNSQITDQAVKILVRLPALIEIDLDSTAVTDACVDDLARLPLGCRFVGLGATRVTAEGRARLRRLRPDLEVLPRP